MISRRGLAGVAAGAVTAVAQRENLAQQLRAIPTPTTAYDTMKDKIGTTQQSEPDPQYWSSRIAHYKKVISGDFSDAMHLFEDRTHGRVYGNIEALKSVSPVARTFFMETVENERKKRQIIKDAKEELDRIMGLPFSVTGLFFK